MPDVPPPARTTAYGIDPAQVYDVRVPTGDPTGTTVVVVHGGFWKAEWDRAHAAPQAQAFADAGHHVAVVEYRRTGMLGGGWPGTFADVSAAVDAGHGGPDAAGPARPRGPLGRRAPRHARGDPTRGQGAGRGRRPGRQRRPRAHPGPGPRRRRGGGRSWATPTTPPGPRPTRPPIRFSRGWCSSMVRPTTRFPSRSPSGSWTGRGRPPATSCSGCPASATWRSSTPPEPAFRVVLDAVARLSGS